MVFLTVVARRQWSDTLDGNVLAVAAVMVTPGTVRTVIQTALSAFALNVVQPYGSVSLPALAHDKSIVEVQ